MNNKEVKVTTEFQVKHGNKWITEDKKEDIISLEMFETSFVKERWEGERRYNRYLTKWGNFHHKMIIKNPFDETERTVRYFEFLTD